MLALAIPTDDRPDRKTIIETNRGKTLEVVDWPNDCEFQLVAFTPTTKTAQVVFPDSLATDIAHALKAILLADAIHGGCQIGIDAYLHTLTERSILPTCI